MKRPRAASRRPSTPPIANRPQWRAFIGRALHCVRQAEAGEQDAIGLLALRHDAGAAQTGLFVRDLGACAGESAAAFVTLVRAFAALTTPPQTRLRMAPAVEALARLVDAFMDDVQARAAASSRDATRADLDL